MKQKHKKDSKSRRSFDKERIGEESKNNKKIKINIGCGRYKIKGYINLDIAKEVNPDILVDIEKKGLPFPDNSVDEIYSSHCLEHIRPQYWSFVLDEIARVAKHKCLLILDLPFDNMVQRSHADHYRTFSWDSFHDHEENSEVLYYSNFILRNLQKRPNILYRLFYTLFPFLKVNVHLEFEIIKNFSSRENEEYTYKERKTYSK